MTTAFTQDQQDALRSIDESVTLAVGLKDSSRGPDLVDEMPDIGLMKVRLDEDVADTFREFCRAAIQRVSSAEHVSYTADAELSSGQIFLLAGKSSVSELEAFREVAAQSASSSPIRPAELDTKVAFYLLATGDDNRIAFVRKSDPRMHHKAGRIWVQGRDKLTSLSGPLFSFASEFDFIVASSWAAVLQQHRFEQLFRDTGLVAKHVSEWVRSVTDQLPMSGESIQELEAAALRDSRLWRRLRSIHARGHLKSVTIDDVRRYAQTVDLDVSKVIQGEELVFESSERFTIMHLLNEDLFRGPLTHDVFEAQRKSSV